ncbi:hypothetical protein LTR94_033719, partial [Friedmanniomyces endolithicus]
MDRLAAGFVDLAKADARPRFGRAVDFDRDRYEGEANLPLPICACRHAGCPEIVAQPIQFAGERVVPRRCPSGRGEIACERAYGRAMTDPFALFDEWFAEAQTSEPNDPNAMALATADAAGRPS